MSATGVRLHDGHCAVDPSIIPYGSVVEISRRGQVPRRGYRIGRHLPHRRPGRWPHRAERGAIVIDLFFENRVEGERSPPATPKYVSISWWTPELDRRRRPAPPAASSPTRTGTRSRASSSNARAKGQLNGRSAPASVLAFCSLFPNLRKIAACKSMTTTSISASTTSWRMTRSAIAFSPSRRSAFSSPTPASRRLPGPTVEALKHEAERAGYRAGKRRLHGRDRGIRRVGARLINANSDEVALLGPTSLGLNLVANGLDWKEGDEVVCYPTIIPANVYPWQALAAQGRARRAAAAGAHRRDHARAGAARR